MVSLSSCRRRRSSLALAFRAVRIVTPYSHVPSRSGSRMERALRASTRKTAWNASSAWCRSRRSCRQTRRTIGPYRATRAAKAASSRRGEPLQQLPVGQPGDRATLIERLDLPGNRGCGRCACSWAPLARALVAGDALGVARNFTDRRLGLADAGLAQLDGLAGPDDELAADLGSITNVAGDDAGAVHDAIGRTRYQRPERDPPLGVDDRSVAVVDRVDPGSAQT